MLGLKNRNFNIMGVHQFLGEGGGHKKTIYRRKLPKKGSLGNLQRTLQKRGRRVFLSGG